MDFDLFSLSGARGRWLYAYNDLNLLEFCYPNPLYMESDGSSYVSNGGGICVTQTEHVTDFFGWNDELS